MSKNNMVLLHKKLDLIASKLGAYQVEPIATIFKRVFDRDDGQQATVIDYFGPWNRQGTWPKMKLCHEYMDYEWQIRRFEEWTGLEFDKLPVLENSHAIKRQYGKVYPHEVQVARPFRLMVVSPDSGDDTGSKKLIISFLPLRYGEDDTPAPEPQPEPAPQQQQTAVSSKSKEYYSSLSTPFEKSAYVTYKYDDFVALVTGVVERWDEENTKKALISVLGESIMFPGQANFSHGRQRVALANALKELADMLEDAVEQVVALQRARDKYEVERVA